MQTCKYFYIIIAALLFLATSDSIVAQYNFDSIVDHKPPSPTAASLGAFGNIPVSMFTGQPNVSIPLGSVNGLTPIDLDLSYNLSSLKVNSAPSWVGWGWSLNAGGAITRLVKGLPDDSEYGYISTGNKITNEIWDYSEQLVEGAYDTSSSIGLYLYQVKNRTADPEPDEFYFNVGGHSGRFFIDHNGDIHVASRSELTIEIVSSSELNPEFQYHAIIYDELNINKRDRGISSWRLIDQDGVVYTFGSSTGDGVEYHHSRRYDTNGTQSFCRDNCVYPSAWYLTSVVHPSGDSFVLNYERYVVSEDFYMYLPSETRYFYRINTNPGHDLCSDLTGSNSHIRSRNERVRYGAALTKISSQYQDVFLYSSSDYIAPTGIAPRGSEPRLDSLAFFEGDNHLKTVRLKYIDESNAASQFGYRLMLQSVDVASPDQAVQSSYSLEYYDSGRSLPGGFSSSSIDHWGYFNGAGNAVSSSIPTVFYPLPSSQTWGIAEGANRDPSLSDNLIGALKRVVYPTGGSVELKYEQHDYGMIGGSNVSATIPVIETDSLGISGNDFFEGQCDSESFSVTIGAHDEITFRSVVGHFIESINCQDDPSNPSCGLVTAPTCDSNHCAWLTIRDPNGTLIESMNSGAVYSSSSEPERTIFVKHRPGVYNVNINLCHPGGDDFFTIGVSYEHKKFINVGFDSNVSGAPAGGLRVKEMVRRYGNNTSDVVSESYRYMSDHVMGISSGVLLNVPVYSHAGGASMGSPDNPGGSCIWAYAQSQPLYDLGGSAGSPVYYSRVEVVRNDGSKTVHRFHSELATFEPLFGGGASVPMWHPTARTRGDHRLGTLLGVSNYDSNGNIIDNDQFIYEENNVSDVERVVRARAIAIRYADTFSVGNNFTIYHFRRYQDISEWRRLVSRIQTIRSN